MEFNEKLQELRRRRGMTQEELAEQLFVSRTAISKWESGRGYPNIDSLKAISKFFGVSIDDLLSGDELLNLAVEDARQMEQRRFVRMCGLLDLGGLLLLLLPLFGQMKGEAVRAVSLLALSGIAPWLRAAYFAVTISMMLSGVLMLVLRSRMRCAADISLSVNAVGALVFIMSRQPYAAAFLFVFCVIKVLMFNQWR